LNEIVKILYGQDISIRHLTPNSSGAVFPAFVHEATLTESTLDLLVLFFDRVLLYVDTFNIEKGNESRTVEKLDAYIENNFISIFSWDPEVSTPISLRTPHVVPPPPTVFGSWSIPEWIERLANLLTADDFKKAPAESVRSLWKTTPLPFVPWVEESIARYHILNRLNGFLILCELLGASVLTDPVMKAASQQKYIASHCEPRKSHSEAEARRDIMFGLIDWYGGTALELPRFADASTLIKLRNESGPSSFVNYVIDLYDSERTKSLSERELVARVTTAIDRQVDLALRITGKSYQKKKVLLAGLIATIGGFLGGELGAIVGGVGASVIPESLEYLDRKRVAPWSTFFLEA